AVVKDLESLPTDDQRKADFELLPPEMQSAVRLAYQVARVERSVEKVPQDGKLEKRTDCGRAFGCCVTAYNFCGCPMYAFHQTVTFMYTFSAVAVVGASQWGSVFSPMWAWTGVMAQSSMNVGVFADVFAQGSFMGAGWLGWGWGMNTSAFI